MKIIKLFGYVTLNLLNFILVTKKNIVFNLIED